LLLTSIRDIFKLSNKFKEIDFKVSERIDIFNFAVTSIDVLLS